MTSLPYHPWRTFTVQQANACLPLVRCIVGDMVELSRSMVERRQRLDRLTAGRDFSRDDVYSQELVQVETELEKDNERLQGFAKELLQLGVEPKGALEGLVDFPAVREGRLVYLCWRYNEPEVLYWHDLEAGFAGRQPLVSETCAEPACGHDAQPAG
ncbi:MAG: DUF2203 domain-containing protein [Pirellulaceae bacterium]